MFLNSVYFYLKFAQIIEHNPDRYTYQVKLHSIIFCFNFCSQNSVSPVGTKYRSTADSHSSHGSDDGRGSLFSLLNYLMNIS